MASFPSILVNLELPGPRIRHYHSFSFFVDTFSLPSVIVDLTHLPHPTPLAVSASDGSNVVTIFNESIGLAVEFKKEIAQKGTFVDDVLNFIQEEERNANGLFSK